MNYPDFSVIIPVYNRPRMVVRAIDSVLKQSVPPREVIVVDDGSNDRTGRVLSPYLPAIKILRISHAGVSAARNAGIRAAGAQWLAFLDSDDEWLPDKLKMAGDFITSHPDVRIFQSEEIWVRNGRRVNPKQKHRKQGGWIFTACLPLCIVSPSAVVIHREIFEKVGYFDESLPVCEDYDLWLRVSRRFPIGLDDRAGIVKYGGHADQLSRQSWGMDHFRVLAIEKQLNDPQLSGEQRRAALQVYRQKLRILINGFEKRGKDAGIYLAKLGDSDHLD